MNKHWRVLVSVLIVLGVGMLGYPTPDESFAWSQHTADSGWRKAPTAGMSCVMSLSEGERDAELAGNPPEP